MSEVGARAGADALLGQARRRVSAVSLAGRDAQDEPDRFPSIRLDGDGENERTVTRRDGQYAEALFRRHGALLLENALPQSLVRACQHGFIDAKDSFASMIANKTARSVGGQRYMFTLDVTGAFGDQRLLASPAFISILRRLLGDGFILGAMTCVVSLGGCKEQQWHRDNPLPFEGSGLPPEDSFSINVMVPLIDVDDAVGGTAIMKGTHRGQGAYLPKDPIQSGPVRLGSVYLLDSRIFHAGLANTSDVARPVISMVFQKPWYRDTVNFTQQAALSITPAAVARLDPAHRALVDWAL